MNGDPSAQFADKDRADLYALYRPKSPQIIVDRIISFVKEKYGGKLELAIDVGCGNGQCTDLLAPHFTRILATDISDSQIGVAKSLTHFPNITFRSCPAESCPVETGSVQLVNAAKAAHWFKLPAFFEEVERILCPNGILSMFSNAPCILSFEDFYSSKVANELLRALIVLEKEKLGPYWSTNIRLVNDEYAEIFKLIPFKGAIREEFWIEEHETIEGMNNYIRTWSSFQNYCNSNGIEAGQEILDELTAKFKRALGAEDQTDNSQVEFKMKRKYFLVMGQKT